MKHRILFAIIYSIVYWFLAIWNVGPEGQGTIIFFAPLMPWFILFIALFLLDKLEDLRNKIFFVGIMFLHYGLTLFFLYAFSRGTYRGKSNLDRGLEQPEMMAITAAWYAFGQILIWFAFFREKNQENKIKAL